MPIIGIAQVLVEPVTTGLQRQVSNAVGRSMPSVGRDAGQRLGRGMADGFSEQSASLEAEVNQLAGVVSKAESDLDKAREKRATARAAESKALGDLRVAELKLQELRETSGVQASKIAAAEERVSVTRHRATAATQTHQASLRRLSDSMASVSSAQHDSSRASEELATHLRRTTTESDNAERGFGRLGARLRSAFQGNPLQGMVESIRRDRRRIVPDLHAMADDVSKAGTRGGRAFTQAFVGVVGGLSVIPPAAGAVGAALVGAAGNALTLGASLGSLAGVAALVPAGFMAIGAGAGVMVSAFAGVGTALKAVTDQQDAFTANPRIAAMAVQDAMQSITVAEENAARAQESAARRVQDAKRSLQDTIEAVAESERRASEAIVAATRRVVDAKQSLKDAVESAADSEESAAEAVEQATRRVRDAKILLQDTVERVAESQKSAAQAVVDAQRKEVEATQDVLKAQKALADARDKANARVAEVGKSLAGAGDKAVDTAKALQVATDAYNQANADPSTSASQLAKLDAQVARARANDEVAKQAVIDLGKEQKAAQDAAKKGGDAVLSAEEKLAKARQSAADAVKATQDAQAKAVKVQRDGARSIADAQEDIADAIKAQKKAHENVSKAAEQSARRVKDAQQGIADAIKDEKDARAEAVKAGTDGARDIADAQQAVADASKEAKQSQVDSARAVEQAHRNLERVQMQQADQAAQAGDASAKAMADLTPAAATAVGALLLVKDQLSGIRRIAQQNFFTGFTGPLLNLAKTVMPQLAVGVGSIATALGGGAQSMMNSLSSALGGGVLTGLLEGVATSITIMNKAIDPLVQSFVTLGVVGMDYMPRLSQAIVNMADGFNAFIQDSAASGQLNTWIEQGIQGFKDIGSIIGSVADIFGSLTQAAEAGGAVSTLGGLAEGLRNVATLMEGETFQKTMSTIFTGAEAGSQGLLGALSAIGDAFVVGAPALADFLRLGGEIAGTFIGGIFTALSNPEFGAGLTIFMEAIQRGVENVVPLLPGLTSGLGSFLESMAPIVEKLGPTLVEVFTGFGHAAGFLLDAFGPLINAIAGSPLILGLLIASFAATAGAAAVLTAAGNVQKIAMAGWRVATTLFSVAQGVLSAAFGRGTASIAANRAAMVGYKIATGLGTAATWLAVAAQKAFNFAMKANPIMKIIAIIGLLVGAIVWLYNNNETARAVIDAVWAGIKSAVEVAWNWIKGAFENMRTWFTVTLPEIWNSFKAINAAVWNGIKTKISDIWGGIKTTFNTIVTFIKDTLGAAFTWFRDSVIKPVWDKISSIITGVWENGIKPIFDIIQDVLAGDFTGAFDTAVSAIEKIWDGLKAVAKKPIEFIINTVINDGLIGAFNKVTGMIGMDPLGEVKIPGFARGGWTGPGSKHQEAGIVHADEYVVRKESQRSIERKAPGFLDSLNNLGAKALGYANGGLVKPVRGGSVTSRFGASRGRYPHAGIDFAVPVGTPVFAALDGKVQRAGRNVVTGRTGVGGFLDHEGGRNTYYGHLTKMLVNVGDMVKAGQQIALSGNTGNSTGPHLHFETWTGGKPVNPEAYLNGATLPSGENSDGGGFNPLSGLIDLASSIGGKFAEAFPIGGRMVDIAKGIGGKVIGDVKDWAFNKLAAIGDVAQDAWSNTKDFFNGRDSDVQSAVRGVANGFGWGSGRQWDYLSNLISRESSWNPNAQNPNSTAYGLFQFLNSTWRGVGASKTSDPTGQAQAGLKYISKRYGDPEKAIGFHDRNGWYADGGLVEDRPKLYDNGGVLNPGLSTILNASEKPEAILNNRQWADISKLALQNAQMSFPETVTLNVDGYQMTAYVERTTNGVLAGHRRGVQQANRQMQGSRN